MPCRYSDDFNFSYIPDVYDDEVVHVYYENQQVIDTVMGVKLFPELVRDATSWG